VSCLSSSLSIAENDPSKTSFDSQITSIACSRTSRLRQLVRLKLRQYQRAEPRCLHFLTCRMGGLSTSNRPNYIPIRVFQPRDVELLWAIGFSPFLEAVKADIMSSKGLTRERGQRFLLLAPMRPKLNQGNSFQRSL
jgi:hypothetical protein